MITLRVNAWEWKYNCFFLFLNKCTTVDLQGLHDKKRCCLCLLTITAAPL